MMSGKAGMKKGSVVKLNGLNARYTVMSRRKNIIFISHDPNKNQLGMLVEDFHYDRHMHCWKNYYSEYEVKPK